MTKEQIEAERLLFDLYASDDGVWPNAIKRDINGEYGLIVTGNAWAAWLARAELECTKLRDLTDEEIMDIYSEGPLYHAPIHELEHEADREEEKSALLCFARDIIAMSRGGIKEIMK